MATKRTKKSAELGGLSEIELDLLSLFFTFADQYGTVDVRGCKKWAQDTLNVSIKEVPVLIEQAHVDILVANNILPDIGPIMERIKRGPVPRLSGPPANLE